MTEHDPGNPGHAASEAVTGGAHLEKGLHHGQRGQELGTTVEMPAEGPPGDSAVSPPPPAAGTDSAPAPEPEPEPE